MEGQEKEAENGTNSRMNCEECTEEDKKSRGCDGGVKWTIGAHTVDGCPEKYINSENMTYIRIWNDWKMFGLPFPGHWSEQPHFVIDAIKILENEMTVIRKEKQ